MNNSIKPAGTNQSTRHFPSGVQPYRSGGGRIHTIHDFPSQPSNNMDCLDELIADVEQLCEITFKNREDSEQLISEIQGAQDSLPRQMSGLEITTTFLSTWVARVPTFLIAVPAFLTAVNEGVRNSWNGLSQNASRNQPPQERRDSQPAGSSSSPDREPEVKEVASPSVLNDQIS